ncbi:MAG: GGDEF domain-containing protein [Spirochaetia bacterium]|nr:GGDEF domain-containing protein [Spirochaetia bacterium]
MPLLYYVQNSITAMVLISVILFYVLGQGGRRQAQDSLFVALLISTFLVVIFELSVDIFSGRTFYGSRPLLIFSTFMFYVFNPFPSVFYFLYLDQLRRRWVKIPWPIGVLAFSPAIIGFFLTTASLFKGMIFSIDAANVYHRGSSFFLITIFDLMCLLFGVIYLIYYRESFKKRDFSLFIFFPVPVLIAVVLQVAIYGLEMVGLSLALTMLIVYLQMQSSQANKDYLTLLYNRGVSEKYLEHLLLKRRKKLIGGIMMDINNFKHVNDMYGHDLGDRCLRYFSKLLRESFKNNWLIGRFGGDEFVLFKEVDSLEEIKHDLASFQEHVSTFNTEGTLPFFLSVSTGFAVLSPNDTMEATAFIKALDTLMYENKRKYHASNRKKSIEHSPNEEFDIL